MGSYDHVPAFVLHCWVGYVLLVEFNSSDHGGIKISAGDDAKRQLSNSTLFKVDR